MALQLESQILWGTGLENVLAFDYPALLDNKRHWRRPAPGSERARNSAGVTDASVTGYDYMLAGRARWFNSALWSGGPGIQEFLDWAGRGNVFRFVPDKNAPAFYVDNVTLDEPFDDPAPDLEEADGSQSLDIVLRNPTADFGQALRGIMFEYAPGASITDPVAATFSRASAATRRGLPGTLAAAVGASDAVNVLRDRHYEGSLRTTLLEAARTQLVTDPENFGAWTAINTPTLTSAQADPFGVTAAYLVEDNDAVNIEAVTQTVTFTGDGEKCIALFIKQGTASRNYLAVWDSTASTYRHRVLVDWSGGVPTLSTNIGAGTRFTPVSWGSGWWLVAISATGVVAANVNRFEISPAGNVSASTGTAFFFGANSWNAPFPSSYQGPSLASRSDDVLSWSFSHKPQAMFLYHKYVSVGGEALATYWPFGIGNANPARTGFEVNGPITSNINFYHQPTAGSFQSNGAIAGTIVKGDLIELLGVLNADGSARIRISRNGGAEAVGSLSAAGAFDAAWAGNLLRYPWISTLSWEAVAASKVGPLTLGGVTRDTIAKARAA